MDVAPLRVGLVGAGPWAALVHAPMLAGHPRTDLAGVWARRLDAAQEVAGAHGAVAFGTFQELLDASDAVAFAVPPDVQARLAVLAAGAGKPVLLEKPLALDLEGAAAVAEAVREAGVGSQILLTWRYSAGFRSFLGSLVDAEPIGGRAIFVSGGALGGPFATPWRLSRGMLLDVGPHVLDALEAALGTIVAVEARGDVHRWVGLLVQHGSGLVSEASMSATSAVQPARMGVEVFTADGAAAFDAASALGPQAFATAVDEFVEVAAGALHVLDAAHGLHLQELLDQAERSLGRSRPPSPAGLRRVDDGGG